jgi:hypothetical protein
LIADTLNAVFLDTLDIESVSFDAYFEDLTVSTAEIYSVNAFTLYPNPASSVLNIKCNKPSGDNLNYEIIDVNGRNIKEGRLDNMTHENQINIHNIPCGVYVIKLYNSTLTTSQLRFVKCSTD